MSTIFQETLALVSKLSAQEQMALIAVLSQQVYEMNVLPQELADQVQLPTEVEEALLARIAEYEQGKSTTISGDRFRDELREKYGY